MPKAKPKKHFSYGNWHTRRGIPPKRFVPLKRKAQEEEDEIALRDGEVAKGDEKVRKGPRCTRKNLDFYRSEEPPVIKRLPATNDPLEKNCSHKQPMPAGYVFVPKGNIFQTRNCRLRTKAAQKEVYVVLDEKNKRIGLRVPANVYEEVRHDESTGRVKRQNAVQARDKKDKARYKKILKDQFPKMPSHFIDSVVDHAYLKNTGRVGRTKTLPEKVKASLAVGSYVRHELTKYDDYLRGDMSRLNARSAIEPAMKFIVKVWQGKKAPREMFGITRHMKGDAQDEIYDRIFRLDP